MTPADVDEIAAEGAAARRNLLLYFDNPAFRDASPCETVQEMYAWHARACAWAAGWLRQDEGRSEDILALSRLRSQ